MSRVTMGLRLTTALLAGRLASALSRRLRAGGGTVISGHLVQRIAPDTLRTIAGRLNHGSVLVSGTNGKTTTSRILSHLLKAQGYRPLHNRAGANLMSGLTSAMVAQTDLRGRPEGDIGIFEVDEATLPQAIAELRPRLVLLTNLFRDQLDRYGEVHYLFSLWTDALKMLPAETRLVLNADDPLVAALGIDRPEVLYFGLEDRSLALERPPHAADARLCTRCGQRYEVSLSFYGHLSHYSCAGCGFGRPIPSVRVLGCSLRPEAATDLQIADGPLELRSRLHLPGLYSVYNALAAFAAASALGLNPRRAAHDLETFSAVFGRLERVEVEGRHLFLALVKNPVGFTEVLRTVVPDQRGIHLAIFINDLFADGTDVSWLWDVDFELIAENVTRVVCSGTRAEDIAVRLKYAGVPTTSLIVERDPTRALEEALLASDPGETIYLLPTYTAMLAVRDVLRKHGYVRHFSED